MHTKPSAAAILRFLCGSIFVMAFCAVAAGQEPQRRLVSTSGVFNLEAEASDPDGIHEYSYDLARLIVPDQAGADYINSFADRLAKAEQEAREGKRKLVSEADVVRAFNEMMRGSGIRPPVTADADADALRRFRAHGAAIEAFPALLSADRNGANCNPGEAVYLIWLLERNKGVLSERYLDREIRLEGLVKVPEEQVATQRSVDPEIVRPPEKRENPEELSIGAMSVQTMTVKLDGKNSGSLARRQHRAAIKQSNAVAKVLGF
jgi:hypothetical protein